MFSPEFNERMDFLKLCISYNNKNKSFQNMLQHHSNKYFWVRNNYERAIIITQKKFLSHIKEEVKDRSINKIKIELNKLTSSSKSLKKRKKDLMKNLDIPKKYTVLFELLSLLISKPEKVFTREEIFDRVWGENSIVGDRTIDVHIRKLREKIGDKNIKTIKGIGYKYVVT